MKSMRHTPFSILIIILLITFPILVLAEGGGSPGLPPPGGGPGNGGDTGGNTGSLTLELPNPLSCDGAECILNTIIKALIMIGAPIAVLMILIGAFQIMTAGGSTEKVDSGRKTITYAVIGFAILLLSSSFIYIIKDLLGASD